MNVRRIEVSHEILSAYSLAPVATSTTAKAISKPERLVIVTSRTSRAPAVISVLIEEAATFRRTLRSTSAVCGSVDVDSRRRALEQGSITNSPAHDVDLDVGVWEVIPAVEPLEPFLILLASDGGYLVSLSLRHGSVGLPTNTHVDGSMSRLSVPRKFIRQERLS